MRIQPISDVHTEFHPDNGVSFFETLPVLGGVLILAGDIGSHDTLPTVLQIACSRWDQVIFVAGNHESYGHTVEQTRDLIHGLHDGGNYNLHYLDHNIEDIDGKVFAGCTLWYKPDPRNLLIGIGRHDSTDPNRRGQRFADYRYIEDWKTEAEIECAKGLYFLENLNAKPDVMVTHHAPSYQSVKEHFKPDSKNLFFACPYDNIVADIGAKVWIHGHMHDASDYMIEDTRVICNPHGYPNEHVDFPPNLALTIDI